MLISGIVIFINFINLDMFEIEKSETDHKNGKYQNK